MNLRRQLRRFPQRLKKQTPTKVHCPTQAFSQLSWTKPLLGQICPFILAWHRYFIFFCLLSLSFLLFSFLLFIESLNRVSFLVEERTREREADQERGWECWGWDERPRNPASDSTSAEKKQQPQVVQQLCAATPALPKRQSTSTSHKLPMDQSSAAADLLCLVNSWPVEGAKASRSTELTIFKAFRPVLSQHFPFAGPRT